MNADFSKTGEKNLGRFQKYPDTCGQGLCSIPRQQQSLSILSIECQINCISAGAAKLALYVKFQFKNVEI